MLLATELVPSSKVSTRDVSYPSPSCNIPLNQHKLIRSVSGVAFELAKISFAKAKVVISVNDGQNAILTREHELIGQLLMHCAAPVAGGVKANLCDARRVSRSGGWWNNRSQEKGKRLSEARCRVSDRWALSGIMGFCHTALRCAEGAVVSMLLTLITKGDRNGSSKEG